MEVSQLINELKNNGFVSIGDYLFEKNIENISFLCGLNMGVAEFYIICNNPRCNTTPVKREIFEIQKYDDVEFTYEYILRKFFLEMSNKFVLSFKQNKTTI